MSFKSIVSIQECFVFKNPRTIYIGIYKTTKTYMKVLHIYFNLILFPILQDPQEFWFLKTQRSKNMEPKNFSFSCRIRCPDTQSKKNQAYLTLQLTIYEQKNFGIIDPMLFIFKIKIYSRQNPFI